MGQTKHTPLPWKIAFVRPTPGSRLVHDWHIEDAAGKLVCWVPEVGPANAEFIVRACNSHEQLLEACKNLLTALDNCPGEFNYSSAVEDAAGAAIAAAQKEQT